jgi:hypothetical protein
LVQNFAAQAVIAIENTGLLNELRQSLEQQTAAAELLEKISCPDSELGLVFKATLANATGLCEASFSFLHLHENGVFLVAAMHNAPPSYVELQQHQSMAGLGSDHPLGRVASTRQTLQILDIRTEAVYRKHEPSYVALARPGRRSDIASCAHGQGK